VAHRHAGVEETVLEGEAAPEQERDHVVAPVRGHVGRLGDQPTVLVDPVRREVGAQVGVRARGPYAGRPGSVTSTTGQACALRWVNSSRSYAWSRGTAIRFACV
jgi:hypothetical protein